MVLAEDHYDIEQVKRALETIVTDYEGVSAHVTSMKMVTGSVQILISGVSVKLKMNTISGDMVDTIYPIIQ